MEILKRGKLNHLDFFHQIKMNQASNINRKNLRKNEKKHFLYLHYEKCNVILIMFKWIFFSFYDIEFN